MTIAFYAPLKSPKHPVPSGDRAMARAILAALEHGGFDVSLVSELRIYDKFGDVGEQARLASAAKLEVARLLADPAASLWRAWVTYHNYYKAPDLIGPAVCEGLGIPYFQVESTRARKRLSGPWAKFAHAAEAASDAAHTIFYVTQRDAETLRRDAPDGQNLIHLPPFLARAKMPPESTRTGPMLSVGMMRPGDKLASYRLIADALAHLPQGLDWALEIAGDGPVRADVADIMSPFQKRVTLLGALDAEPLEKAYAQASLFFWPGVNEAFGLVYLEAQAAGLPVVAQDRPGVCDVVYGRHPDPQEGPKAMAHQIAHLLSNDIERNQTGRAARNMVVSRHLIGAAAAKLKSVLGPVL